MLEETLAFAKEKPEEREVINLQIPSSTKSCITELAKEHGVTFTSIVASALKVVCEEWKLGSCEAITKEKADLFKLLHQNEEKLDKYLAESEYEESFEHRGYLFSKENSEGLQPKIDNLITRIERVKKDLGIEKEDEKLIYQGEH